MAFLPNGQLNGMKPFLGYVLCYAGDCLEETEPASRTIDLIDEKGQKQTFAFKSIEGKMAIELYSIGPPIPDMKVAGYGRTGKLRALRKGGMANQ